MDAKLLPFATQDVPRYTSYPTAVQFQSDFSSATADGWLKALAPDAVLSLYVHIPFCQQLCWYCGCHTSVPNTYDRATRYVAALLKDIERGGALKGTKHGAVKHFHFGGGTPTYLTNDDLRSIVEAVDRAFGISAGAEVAIESDPRGMTPERARALTAMGFNRISFGVQDFAQPVMDKINRQQPYDLVARATEELRAAGFVSVNYDLMYGLPGQTVESVIETATMSAALKPNRISVFGYAHVPWFAKHQKMIRDHDLPDIPARYDQAVAINETLTAHGYAAIGLDHYALLDDELSKAAEAGTMHRNFQGYTTDTADALVAFGASAISEYPQGFAQAARDTLAWSTAIEKGDSPVNRGLATTAEDRMRAEVIERLMCDFTVDYAAVAARHGFDPAVLDQGLARLEPLMAAGLADWQGTVVSVPRKHRLFLRSAASAFDAHYKVVANRHAKAV
jgi:oxygen-independent coproporphyrinogen-3 oxidase